MRSQDDGPDLSITNPRKVTSLTNLTTSLEIRKLEGLVLSCVIAKKLGLVLGDAHPYAAGNR